MPGAATIFYGKLGNEVRIVSQRKLQARAAAQVLTALRTGYVYSLGLEEDTGWAEQFPAAFDRVIDER